LLLAVIIHGADNKFNMIEERAFLQNIESVTTGTNLMAELDKVMTKLRLGYSSLVNLVNDGAPSISGVINTLVAIIKNKMELINDS
jgi:hypothetical protein